MINDLEIYRQKQLEYQNDLGMLIVIANQHGDTKKWWKKENWIL